MKTIVKEWKGAPQMDTGAPMPHIILTADNRDLICAYIVSEGTIEAPSKEEYAVVIFSGVTQFTFGYPNDEVLGAHPLYRLGIKFYAFNLIENSPYLHELGRRNATIFPGSEGHYTQRKHYLVAFHDETLEVICQDIAFLGQTEASNGKDAINIIMAEQQH
jgi:hypothetical protein